jgi:hypothetical protein
VLPKQYQSGEGLILWMVLVMVYESIIIINNIIKEKWHI